VPGIALCYSRKSFVRTAADEVSPARQRAAIVAEAERHGWTAELFEDAEGHRSGRTENAQAGSISSHDLKILTSKRSSSRVYRALRAAYGIFTI